MNRIEDFDSYIEGARPSWDCPGAALSIIRGDEILYQNAFGLRDVEEQLPMTVDTRFPMASITKSVTAMSVALLVDEGKLEWDKPVREVIPEFILDDPYVTQHVTVRDMLSHRTGLPRHDFSAWRLDITRAEYIQRMRHLKFSATFREKFQYNNLMYYAAAYLVEKIAGQKWEDFVTARIFKPLGMDASNFEPEPPQPDQFNATGYRVERDDTGAAEELIPLPFGRHTDLSPGAAGALFSTLEDLTRWLKVHTNRGRSGEFRLVSEDNLKQMHLPQTVIPGGGLNEILMNNTIFTYGMGWFVEPYRGYTLIHHGGNVEGHSLILGFVPQEEIGVVALTNIGLLPLRDVLLYKGMDRALGLPEEDWNARFHSVFDPIIQAEAKAKVTSSEERIAGAPPTHPLETYIDTFEAEGYPDFAVRDTEKGLQACTVGGLDWSEFRHYHYDVFEWHWPDFDAWYKVRFLMDDRGEIDGVSIPIEPEVDNVIFTRKQPGLTEELIASLVGQYELPMEGMAITIHASEGRVFAALTGSPPEEIKPYKLTSELVAFRMSRDRLEFRRDGDSIPEVIWKSQFMTMEAPRKKVSGDRG